MPLISIIIPTYNSEKTIKDTIESVLEQTLTDYELIVINDGSSDSTLDIVSQFHDSRIKVFSYPHQGANVSRNLGLAHAAGEFISFLDADDLWTSDKLASQMKALQENPQASVAYSWTDYIDEKGEFLLAGMHITANGNVYEQLLVNNFVENGSNPLIRKEALLKLGGFDENLSAGQDWDMWLRLARECSFVAVPKVQILYRKSSNSLSSNLARQEKACLKVLDKAYNDSPKYLQNLRKQSLTNLYKYLTCKAMEKPFNRQKGSVAARFLWKYVINDASRLDHIKLTLKLFLKIVLIATLPSNLSTALLTGIKTKTKTAIKS
ncbi:MAG: glycosyltransferase [Fischerella sp.]|nr:glycosyltransferase [Fischerella sp.]